MHQLAGALELAPRTAELVSGSASTTVPNASSWSESAASVWARTSWISRARWLRSARSSARSRSTSVRAASTSARASCSDRSVVWRREMPMRAPPRIAARAPSTTPGERSVASSAAPTATPARRGRPGRHLRAPADGGAEDGHRREDHGQRREGGEQRRRRPPSPRRRPVTTGCRPGVPPSPRSTPPRRRPAGPLRPPGGRTPGAGPAPEETPQTSRPSEARLSALDRGVHRAGTSGVSLGAFTVPHHGPRKPRPWPGRCRRPGRGRRRASADGRPYPARRGCPSGTPPRTGPSG